MHSKEAASRTDVASVYDGILYLGMMDTGPRTELWKDGTSLGPWIYLWAAELTNLCVCAQQLQSSFPFCDHLDCGLLGSSDHGIFLARILEWVAMPSSRGSFRPRDAIHISCVSCVASEFFTAEPPGKPLTNLRAPLSWDFFLQRQHFFLLKLNDRNEQSLAKDQCLPYVM